MSPSGPKASKDQIDQVFRLMRLAAEQNEAESARVIEATAKDHHAAEAVIGHSVGLLTYLADQHYPGGMDAFQADVNKWPAGQ